MKSDFMWLLKEGHFIYLLILKWFDFNKRFYIILFLIKSDYNFQVKLMLFWN